MVNARLSFAFRNYFFDSDDYNQPIKGYLDDKVWFKVVPELEK